MATPQSRPPSPALICAAGLLSLAAAMGIGRFAFTPMLPLMLRDGQLDVALGGWLASANYAGYLAGALSASRVPLRAPALALLALALTAMLTAAMALPGGIGYWLALRFGAGVCSAWVFVATAIWCLGALAAAGRSSLAGAVYSGVGAGIALAGLYCLAGAAAGAGAPALWLQLGGVALALGLPVAVVLARLPVSAAAPVATQAAMAAAPTAQWGLVLCYGVFGFGYILPATFLPVLARSVVDDARLFGLAWPVFGAAAALSTLLLAWWLHRTTRLQAWAVSHLLMAAGLVLPSLWLNGWTIGLSALLVGGTFMVITMAGVQEIRARAVGDPTRLVGRMTAAFALGQIAGPVLSALLVQHAGSGGLALALQAGAASLLASAAWLWRLSFPATSRQELSDAIR
jgi:predicted MFS family arabinose efflux permease